MNTIRLRHHSYRLHKFKCHCFTHTYVWCPRNSDCASGYGSHDRMKSHGIEMTNSWLSIQFWVFSLVYFYPLHSPAPIHTLDSREFSFQNERKENMKWKRMKTHDNRNPNTHNECDRVKNTEKTRHLHLRIEQAQYGSRIRWRNTPCTKRNQL